MSALLTPLPDLPFPGQPSVVPALLAPLPDLSLPVQHPVVHALLAPLTGLSLPRPPLLSLSDLAVSFAPLHP